MPVKYICTKCGATSEAVNVSPQLTVLPPGWLPLQVGTQVRGEFCPPCVNAVVEFLGGKAAPPTNTEVQEII